MSRKVAILLLTLFAYTLVLLHGLMPHQHHEADTHSHAHKGSHSHDAHSQDEPSEKENPLSHYFHSTIQGEPHLTTRQDTLLSENQVEAIAAKTTYAPVVVENAVALVQTTYCKGFSPPPHFLSLPQRGPPTA